MESQTEQYPVFGRFRLLEELGEGGMAVVYRARMEGLDGFSKVVALKVVHPELAQAPEFAAAFISEARLGGLLSHPNLVEIQDFGRHRGRLYLAMEYVNGPTLSHLINWHRFHRRPIPPEIALELTIQACRGLDYAHRAVDHDGRPLRMVHRDLKPSNLMLNLHGLLKVADFGVARAESNVTRTAHTGLMKGTACYMSPEQAWARRDLDHRSDLFTLGLILFELLVLERFYTEDAVELALRQAQDVELDARLPELPDSPVRGALEAVLRKALAKERDARYATCGDLAAALEQVLGQIPARVSLHGFLEGIAEEWQKRQPVSPFRAFMWADGAASATASVLSEEPVNPATLLPSRGGEAGRPTGTSPGGEGPRAPHTNLPPRTALPLEDDPGPSQLTGARDRRLPGWVWALVGGLGGCLLLLGGWWLKGREDVARTQSNAVGQLSDIKADSGGKVPGAVPAAQATPLPQVVAQAPSPSVEPGTPVPLASTPAPTPAEMASKPVGTRPSSGKPTPDKPAGPLSTTPRDDPSAGSAHTPTGQEARASLSLNARPRATIQVDGKVQAEFPVQDLQLSAGSHRLVFVAEGGERLEHKVKLEAGQRLTCTAIFLEGSVQCRERSGQ